VSHQRCWCGMRIVSENSEADLAHQRAMAPVDWALRDLAANLMRVTRGAGRPHYVGRQAQALVEALSEYRDAIGYFPSPEEIANALAIERSPERIEQMSDEEFDLFRAEHAIVRGSLQIVASRLLDQKTQETAGEDEMYKGLGEIEAIRGKGRRKAPAAKIAGKASVGRKVAKSGPPKTRRKKPESLEVRRRLPQATA
jgi:hypothetical protein